MSGSDDGRWVEVEGVIHSVTRSAHNETITLALRDGIIRAVTPLEAGSDYDRLVDATVAMHANAAPLYNKRRQLVGVRLLFPSLAVPSDSVRTTAIASPGVRIKECAATLRSRTNDIFLPSYPVCQGYQHHTSQY